MSASFLTDLAGTTILGRTVSSSTATTASGNGTAIDMQLTDGPIHALVDCSASSGTTPQVVIQLQESSDQTTWTNIPSDSDNQPASTTLTAAGLLFLSTPERLKRYVRASLTVTGTTPSFTLSVILVGRKKIVGSGSGFTNASAPGAGF